MTYRFSICTLILLTAIMVGCNDFGKLTKANQSVSKEDILLASVEDRVMYLSEVKDMISSDSELDSLSQLNALIESWIKRNVVLTEAENNFPVNIDINKLVEDYKSSLLLHNYRQVLVEKELDTVVSNQQEIEYYEINKEQYRLQNKICKGRMASIHEDAPKLEKFYRSWKKDDSLAINSYLEEYANSRLNDLNSWYTIEEFLSFLPHGSFEESDIKQKGDLQKNHDGNEYFVKITEIIDQKEIPPLSYVKESIRKLIIHQRKKQLLDNIEQNLYQKYLSSNRIKVFSKE